MTIEEIVSSDRPISEIIGDLKQKSIRVPSWDILSKEYNPKLHAVHTETTYRDKMVGGDLVKMCRVTLGLEKLAVKRMSELLFGIPCKRIYQNIENDRQKQARNIIEAIYAKNRIDSVNLERARALYASCEIMTIWYTQPTPTLYAGVSTPYKLRCRTFSPMDGAELYPLFDDYDDLVALSVSYSRIVNNQHLQYFETYTATEHIRWVGDGTTWKEDMEREAIHIEKIAGVYAHIPEPIWEDEHSNVEEIEWTLSRNGNYIRKNSKPTWVECVDAQEMRNLRGNKEDNSDTSARNILRYPKGSTVGYQTWNQATDATTFHVETLRKNFFRQLQLPDMSMDEMKNTNMSGEARKMMFIDAQLKVVDEQGIWIEFLHREFSVIRAFAARLFPEYEAEILALEAEIQITPWRIEDEGDKINNYTSATGGKAIMSQRTAIEQLGKVEDVDVELERIQEEETADVFEPTI